MRTFLSTSIAVGALALAGHAPAALAEQTPAGPYAGIGWGHFDLWM